MKNVKNNEQAGLEHPMAYAVTLIVLFPCIYILLARDYAATVERFATGAVILIVAVWLRADRLIKRIFG